MTEIAKGVTATSGLLGEPASDKDRRFQRVADAVVSTLLQRGPESLTISHIARKAEVSRAWLYKYVGAEPEALLQYATLAFGGAFAELDQRYSAPSPAEWRQYLAAGIERGLADTEAHPWILQLYFRFRDDRGALGDAIRRVDQRYIVKFLDEMPAALQRNPGRAQRFVAVFLAARMGVYHRWTDPAFRAQVSAASASAGLLLWIDSYLEQIEHARPGPGL